MSMTIKPCTCTADKHGNTKAATYQDEKLGKGNRYHNSAGGTKGSKHSCTVCGASK